MPPRQPEGFSFRARKSGDVEVWHAGTLASVLRGADAAGFLTKAQRLDEPALQHLMARVTGNYRRGNEKDAAGHARHR